MKKEEKNIIKVSVRNLVEFILRSGDIDNRFAGKSSMKPCSREADCIGRYREQ